MPKRDAEKEANTGWLVSIQRFVESPEWERWEDLLIQRTLLAELYNLLAGTPPNLLQDFNMFPERELGKSIGISKAYDNVRQTISIGQPLKSLLMVSSILLRALDSSLHCGAENIMDDAPECWLTDDQSAYVVPIQSPVMRQGGPKTKQSFSRRGLLFHRVIPTSVGDVDICLVPHGDYELGAGGDRLCGAAFFPAFDLQTDEHGADGFLAVRASCNPSIVEVLNDHCDQIRSEACDTVIWPELTITPESINQISQALSWNPLETARPAVLVAGSWHRETDRGMGNVSPVLNGRGELLLEFGKSRKFIFRDRQEHIVACNRLYILATGSELIAFAICKDFCDKSGKVPISDLDVDLVLVPSMGRLNTMTAHCDAADFIKVQYGTKTVVVQQNYPKPKAAKTLGYALKAPENPRDMRFKQLAESTKFTTFPLRMIKCR